MGVASKAIPFLARMAGKAGKAIVKGAKTVAEHPVMATAAVGGLASGVAGALAGGAIKAVEGDDTPDETPETAPEVADDGDGADAEDTSDDDAPKITHARSDSGAHILTVSKEDSVQYKVASKFGPPMKTKDGQFRFSLTDNEYQRYLREAN